MAKVTTITHGDLAFLPLQPAAPIAETLEWLSDVFQSQNGTESVLQLRDAPRQSFSYTIPEQAWQKEAGLNVEYGALSSLWGIPIWTEAQFLGAVAPTSTLAATVDVYDFRDASLCFLWQDENTYQVLDIATVGAGVLNLSEPTNAYTGAWLMPMRVGRVTGSISRKNKSDNMMTSVAFRCEDNATIPDASAPTQYLGDDIYFDNPLDAGSGVDRVVNTRIDLIDYSLGIVSQRAPWLNNRIDYQRNVLCSSPEEVREFKQWLQRRAGKVKRFWEPSFDNDLRKQSTGTVNSTFLVARDNLTDWSALPRKNVAFELDDGSWLASGVTSITIVSGTQVQLNLGTALAVPASRIRRVSWLGLKRLNTDRVELSWGPGGIMQANMMVTELNP